MSDNTNKQAVINAIWANPAPAFGCTFKQSGRFWENVRGGEYDETGKIRLALTANGGNITVFYNGSSRDEKTDVFTYLQQYHLKTANFADTLRAAADLYGIDLHFTEQERETLRRGELARAVAASLIEHLRKHPDGPTAQYITKTRGLSLDGVHFGELTPESIQAAADSLRQRGKRWAADDLTKLGLTEARAAAGYNCVIPYYLNGIVQGFIYRNIKPDHTGPKYLYSDSLGRGGYCDALTYGQPAVIVEGQLDAVRLIQQGVKNVIAMGGAKMGAEMGRLLRGRGIAEVVYIPDNETDERGRRKIKLVADAIRAFQTVEVDGEKVVKNLLVLDLPTPTGPNAKTDADSYGAAHPGELAGMIEFEPVPGWLWEFERLREWAAVQEQETGRAPTAAVQEQTTDIYTRNGSPFVRQQIREYVGKCADMGKYGVTPQALADVDDWNRGREYQNRIKAAAADLNKAVQDQANPETVGGIVRRLADAQAANVRDEWEAQLTEPFEAELDAIRKQPPTLKTGWVLGNVNKTGAFVAYERIEFWPADIAVFCAPTSHGKTAILFQAAMDLVRNTDKTYLFVSCEENKRQLLERAINVYLPIETTHDGKTDAGAYCFITGTRKRTIKAAIKDGPAPDKYADFMGRSEHFEALKREILRGVEAYGRNVRPRLKFVHTDAAAESICNNVLHYVEAYRAAGVEVGAVFVDYMQLLTTDAPNYSRHDELKDICRALKRCAEIAELPVVIAAQLNREVLRPASGGGAGVDNITVANIGEGADIERIAHDIYLVWQTDKTQLQPYISAPKSPETLAAALRGETPPVDPYRVAAGIRSRRLFTRGELGRPDTMELKRGYLYVEQMKARDGITGSWGLFPFDGERGKIGPNDTQTMCK